MAFIECQQEIRRLLERCLKLVRKGGLILVDNVLWARLGRQPPAER